MRRLLLIAGLSCVLLGQPQGPGWVDLFNGRDLTGWIDLNTSPDTWKVRDGLLVCTGNPIGVMLSARQHENFLLRVESRPMEESGASGGVTP